MGMGLGEVFSRTRICTNWHKCLCGGEVCEKRNRITGLRRICADAMACVVAESAKGRDAEGAKDAEVR